jgi:integrase
MTQKELNNLLDFIRSHPSESSDELVATVLRLAADYASLKAQKNKPPKQESPKEKNFLKFTNQEIDSMPESIKILLIYNERAITYRFHNGVYQTRYRRDGYKIEISSSDLKSLKAKLITELGKNKPKPKENKHYPFIKDFINDWLAMKKITIKDTTFKSYLDIVNVHVIPTFGNIRLNILTRADVQNYLNSLLEQEKNRTAKKLQQILSAAFNFASEEYGIKSPMTKIVLPHYEVKKGNALTKAEEKELVDYCLAHLTQSACHALLILLYTGMRVGELKTATIHDKYIECETEKTRKGYKREFRKIPITPMLRRVLPFIDFKIAISASTDWIGNCFKNIFPNHHTHELRYTFITRCKEHVQNLELVMLWAGHKFDKDVKTSAVDRGYTDYSEEYYFKEAEKVDYEL